MKFADLWAARDHAPATGPATAPTPTSDADGARRYALRALALENDTLAATGEGSRNHQLNTSAFNLGQLIGHLTEAEIVDTLTRTALAIGLSPTEVRATIASGIRSGRQTPRLIPQSAIEQAHVTEVSHADLTGAQPTFWDARPVLAHIRDFALSRMTAPWAVFGGCLLRAVGAAPHFVVLPPTIGGVGSLNLLLGLIGDSGSGKGASEAAAADAISWPAQITAPLGSGEGITHAFAKPRPAKKDDPDPDPDPLIWHTRSVLFTAPEVDQIAAIRNRRGSTLMSQLRSAYTGERLGMQYADATRRIILPSHSYRFGLSVGIQPDRADWLLSEADGGTPQRFLWLPVTDPAITATPQPTPEPWRWAPPLAVPEHVPGARRDNRGRFIMPVPDQVLDTIRAAHAARARGEGDALDGHALFTRLKVAAGLAILDERLALTMEDWTLAGAVMSVSDVTRTRIQARVAARADAADDARAKRDARIADVAEAEKTERAVLRVMKSLASKLKGGGPMTRSEARRAIVSRDRAHFDDALTRLIVAGDAKVAEGDRGEVLTWAAR